MALVQHRKAFSIVVVSFTKNFLCSWYCSHQCTTSNRVTLLRANTADFESQVKRYSMQWPANGPDIGLTRPTAAPPPPYGGGGEVNISVFSNTVDVEVTQCSCRRKRKQIEHRRGILCYMLWNSVGGLFSIFSSREKSYLFGLFIASGKFI
jgi:hypothetical protein